MWQSRSIRERARRVMQERRVLEVGGYVESSLRCLRRIVARLDSRPNYVASVCKSTASLHRDHQDVCAMSQVCGNNLVCDAFQLNNLHPAVNMTKTGMHHQCNTLRWERLEVEIVGVRSCRPFVSHPCSISEKSISLATPDLEHSEFCSTPAAGPSSEELLTSSDIQC